MILYPYYPEIGDFNPSEVQCWQPGFNSGIMVLLLKKFDAQAQVDCSVGYWRTSRREEELAIN
jgi:hypothetical protein